MPEHCVNKFLIQQLINVSELYQDMVVKDMIYHDSIDDDGDISSDITIYFNT